MTNLGLVINVAVTDILKQQTNNNKSRYSEIYVNRITSIKRRLL